MTESSFLPSDCGNKDRCLQWERRRARAGKQRLIGWGEACPPPLRRRLWGLRLHRRPRTASNHQSAVGYFPVSLTWHLPLLRYRNRTEEQNKRTSGHRSVASGQRCMACGKSWCGNAASAPRSSAPHNAPAHERWPSQLSQKKKHHSISNDSNSKQIQIQFHLKGIQIKPKTRLLKTLTLYDHTTAN